LGAPLGGTTRGGQYGLESVTLSSITPPNFSGGGGRSFPLMVVVALGEPGVPVISWAGAGRATNIAAPVSSDKPQYFSLGFMIRFWFYRVVWGNPRRKGGGTGETCAAENWSLCRNETEQVKHDHVHLQVDSALIEQLRAGYAQLGLRRQQQLANPREPGM
jgi:hypothetical protein